MEVGVVDKERLLDIVELAMIGAAFPCGFAPAGDVFCEAFRVLLDGREAVCRFGLVGPTSGPDWRAKPPIASKEEFDDDRMDEEATEATGRLPGAAEGNFCQHGLFGLQ